MPEPETPRPLPARRRPARVALGFDWKPAADVPGAQLSPGQLREQQQKLREIDDTQRRARVRASSYYVG